MIRTFASVLEVVGLLCVVMAAALFDWRLGLAAAGGVLVLVGVALDAPPRPQASE